MPALSFLSGWERRKGLNHCWLFALSPTLCYYVLAELSLTAFDETWRGRHGSSSIRIRGHERVAISLASYCNFAEFSRNSLSTIIIYVYRRTKNRSFCRIFQSIGRKYFSIGRKYFRDRQCNSSWIIYTFVICIVKRTRCNRIYILYIILYVYQHCSDQRQLCNHLLFANFVQF